MATNQNGTHKVKNKLFILLLLMGLIFLALSFRLFYVGIINGSTYAAMAAKQQTKTSTLTAQRGRIIDSSGLVLAQSGTSYRVLVNPQVIAESERVRISIEVSDVLGLDYDYVYERVCRVEKQQIVLKRQVESETIDKLEALQLGNGISFSADVKRYYPMGKLFSQLMGFTGTDGEGQTGIEASYDSYLAGSNGRLVSEVDRNNNALPDGEEEYIPATDGYDITLTADSVAQSYLENVLSDCYSAYNPDQVTACIMNPNTGEIIASSTFPTFDLNAPPRSDVTALLEMSRNRVVSEKFEPGSLFKIIVLAAALDSGSLSTDEIFSCNGYEQYGLDKVYCNNTNGHGKQTVMEALQNNCDCVFMQIAQRIGVNTLYDYMYAFGLGSETKCGIPGEDSGEITHRKYIRNKELAELACGLNLTVTPIQMLRVMSVIANGGILVQPYIIDNITSPAGEIIKKNESTPIKRVISEETASTMRYLLSSYLSVPAYSAAQIVNYTSGGISGVSAKKDENGFKSDTLFLSTFMQFIPANNPQLVLFLMIDEPQVPKAYSRYMSAYWSGAIFTSLVNYYTILPDNGGTDVREVPDVTGMTVTEAASVLNDAHFTTVTLDSEADMTVIKTVPKAGTKLIRGSRVMIYDSSTSLNSEGSVFIETVKVPNLLKQRRSEALDLCIAAGLTLTYDKTACTGYIIDQSIPEGTEVTPGTEIYVTFNGYYAASNITTNTPEPIVETPTPEVVINDDLPVVD